MKAIVLLSGGLDSGLAAKIIQKQGVDLVGLTFKSYFFDATAGARRQAEELGIPLKVRDISQKQWRLVQRPRYGYGKHLNPCLDCHLLMLKEAARLMRQEKADFIVTGEVLNQRPFSQNKEALALITQEAGVAGLVLRPLSARLLPPTIPEKKGWVKRNKLYNIAGKRRAVQISLVKKFTLKNYGSPAGGCLLTDPNFSQRLRKMMAAKKELAASDLHLLKLGRHFWQNGVLLVVGRNEEENKKLVAAAQKGDVLVEMKDIPGPTTLVRSWQKRRIKAAIEKAKDLTRLYSPKAREKKGEVEFKIREV